jgi:hypothetical protein
MMESCGILAFTLYQSRSAREVPNVPKRQKVAYLLRFTYNFGPFWTGDLCAEANRQLTLQHDKLFPKNKNERSRILLSDG